MYIYIYICIEKYDYCNCAIKLTVGNILLKVFSVIDTVEWKCFMRHRHLYVMRYTHPQHSPSYTISWWCARHCVVLSKLHG